LVIASYVRYSRIHLSWMLSGLKFVML
jgi:hypothetical protein